MGFAVSGQPIAYGVPVTNSTLDNPDDGFFRVERHWAVPLPRWDPNQHINIFFVTKTFGLKCIVDLPNNLFGQPSRDDN